MYTLAVDFGTTFTAAAALGADGVPAMVGLGNRAMQVPSTVFVSADGSVLVGEAAERAAVGEPGRARREIKRRIGDDVPILVGGSPYSVGHLAGRVIAWAVERCCERYGEPPADLVLTHPATWRRFKIDVLHQAALQAGLPDVTLVPEPVAAAMFYAAGTRVEVGSRLCVYDLGGGTFDVCVVEKTTAGFRVLGTPGGLDQLGGIDFDEAVFDRVVADLTAESPDLVGALAPVELARLRRDCVEVKEALSSEVSAVASVFRDGRSVDARITRSEFEELIHPAVAQTLEATSRALGSAGLRPADVSAFVLVGGSSRIPLVAQSLVGEFRRPIARDTHPKHDVVLGATLLSPARALRTAEPDPVAPPGTPAMAWRERGRRRRSTALFGMSAAAVLALGGTASWVLLGADRSSAVGVEQAVGSSGETPGNEAASASGPSAGSSAAASPTTSSSMPAPAASTPVPSTPVPSTPVPSTPVPTAGPGSGSSAVPAPPGLDAASAEFLTTICAGAAAINTWKVPAYTEFASVRDAQDAYVLAYAGRASAAGAAAARLQAQLPATVAGGRIDGAKTVAAMRSLGQVLGDGAVSLRALQPATTQDIDERAAAINRAAAQSSVLDPSVLTRDEQEWMTTLPGCGSPR